MVDRVRLTQKGFEASCARKKEALSFWIQPFLYSPQTSAELTGDTLLQSKKGTVVHEAHHAFPLLKFFQAIGFCSTKFRNSIVFLSSCSRGTQVEEFLQIQQSNSCPKVSGQAGQRLTILTPQKHIWHGDPGIVAVHHKARILSTPKNKNVPLFPNCCIILKPDQTLGVLSIFVTTKSTALG